MMELAIWFVIGFIVSPMVVDKMILVMMFLSSVVNPEPATWLACEPLLWNWWNSTVDHFVTWLWSRGLLLKWD